MKWFLQAQKEDEMGFASGWDGFYKPYKPWPRLMSSHPCVFPISSSFRAWRNHLILFQCHLIHFQKGTWGVLIHKPPLWTSRRRGFSARFVDEYSAHSEPRRFDSENASGLVDFGYGVCSQIFASFQTRSYVAILILTVKRNVVWRIGGLKKTRRLLISLLRRYSGILGRGGGLAILSSPFLPSPGMHVELNRRVSTPHPQSI